MPSSPSGSSKTLSEPGSREGSLEAKDGENDYAENGTEIEGPFNSNESPEKGSEGHRSSRRGAGASATYAANKMPHLKKEDGVPLWRKDIQYQFLRYVFEDDNPLFHKLSDGTGGHTFSDIYLDAMAQSSKCSKILKDKLLTDRPAAINMAMVCLLVNIGRINTTLNFFPEMRAQLRTYHSIPSLQAHQDFNNYKQLQDAPRLKSILKGATEDTTQPATLDDIKAAAKPRTNPVNLVFVLAQYAPKVTLLHFDQPLDFFDLVMKPNLSSRSRATAFLWLMWWYLESDFLADDALDNPFGPGRKSSDDSVGVHPLKVPELTTLTPEEEEAENVDTPDEVEFGELKQRERARLINSRDDVVDINEKDKVPTSKTESIPTPIQKRSRRSFGGTHVFSIQSDDGPGTPTEKARGRKKHRWVDSAAPGSSAPTPLKTQIADDEDDQGDSPSPSRARRGPSPLATLSTPIPKSSSRKRTRDPNHTARPYRRRSDKDKGTSGATLKSEGEYLPSFRHQEESDVEDAVQKGHNGQNGIRGALTLSFPGSEKSSKRSRPLTGHQLAVEKYRNDRVCHLLDRRLREQHRRSRKIRSNDSALIRCWARLHDPAYDNLDDPTEYYNGYDSEEEFAIQMAHIKEDPSRARRIGSQLGAMAGWAGLYPGSWEKDKVMKTLSRTQGGTKKGGLELDQFLVKGTGEWGEEVCSFARGLRRVKRRIERWEEGLPVIRKCKDILDQEDEDGNREEDDFLATPIPQSASTSRRRGSSRKHGIDDDNASPSVARKRARRDPDQPRGRRKDLRIVAPRHLDVPDDESVGPMSVDGEGAASQALGDMDEDTTFMDNYNDHDGDGDAATIDEECDTMSHIAVSDGNAPSSPGYEDRNEDEDEDDEDDDDEDEPTIVGNGVRAQGEDDDEEEEDDEGDGNGIVDESEYINHGEETEYGDTEPEDEGTADEEDEDEDEDENDDVDVDGDGDGDITMAG